MQWLINLVAEKVIAEIGVPPCYVDRGDPAEPDFEDTDLIVPTDWRELDLSGIVPAGAVAVHLRTWLQHTTARNYIQFRKHGNTNDINAFTSITQAANTYIFFDGAVGLDEDRKVDYKVVGEDWTIIFITVAGWWL